MISSFSNCGEKPLGLYPVVDSSEWVEKLLPLGVTSIQLRIKNKSKKILENEIQKSVELSRKFNTRLFINDYWELAIAAGAYGVHLGQEDLFSANTTKIYDAGLRLGISTHCHDEVERARSYRPSYIAIGPIFETTSKIMSFTPQGINNLIYWRKILSNYTLVAIGGIHEKNIEAVLQTGVEGVAMISAITQSQDYRQQTKKLLAFVESNINVFKRS